VWLVRPDAHVAAVVPGADTGAVRAAVRTVLGGTADASGADVAADPVRAAADSAVTAAAPVPDPAAAPTPSHPSSPR
jgi:pentachlorophenol monooxygenase/3-(3-hydroxy-phenyl)propionate hydroxylase